MVLDDLRQVMYEEHTQHVVVRRPGEQLAEPDLICRY
jgi:hypothetical protein